jgi:hypothetical protein
MFWSKKPSTSRPYTETVIATSPVTGLSVVARTWDADHAGPVEYFLHDENGTELDLSWYTGGYRFTESKGAALRWMTELVPEQIQSAR